jgi:hypothetical protein
MLAAENSVRSPRATPEPANEDAPELSRTQIAESLAGKDPGWFRQTADRGVGSAALRRAQEDSTDAPGLGSERLRMPGMARNSTLDTDGASSPPADSARSQSPSRASSVRMSTTSSRYSSTTAPSDSGSLRIRSPPPSILDAPKLAPTGSDRKSPLTGRPPSPTKGMGGFVESAMLKRADSVNKRWSAQAPQGLNRQNSTASNRGSYIGGHSGSTSPTRIDRAPSTLSRGNSLEPAPGSRPSSSHSNLAAAQDADNQTADLDRDGFVKPGKPLHNRAKSVASFQKLAQTTAEPSPPSSPSRRWSPTKSSWLESALTKTEDKPKPQPAFPTQPSWMTEINKAKHSRTNSSSQDPSKVPSSERFLPEPISNARTTHPTPPEQAKSPLLEKAMAAPAERTDSTPLKKTVSPPTVKAKSPPPEPAAKPLSLNSAEGSLGTKTTASMASPSMKSSWEAKKPVPTPGKMDFRANLKPRQISTDDSSKNEPEFKNALGKLKRTQTEKFVAPDMLKDNILRGKAGLTITGGPAKRERVDELKESLIKQKEAMKIKASAEPKKPIAKPANLQSTPEALAKRNVLHRSQSSKDSVSIAKSPNEEMPEAIARMKSLMEKATPILPQKPTSIPAKELPTLLSPSLPPSPPQRKPSADNVSPSSPSLSVTSPPMRTNEVVEDVKSKPLALPGMTKPAAIPSKLAGRFNPSLADMLARGPPTSGKSGASSANATLAAHDASLSSSGPLEHKTKGRARGPKRRAPTKQAEEVATKKLSPALAQSGLNSASGAASASISTPVDTATLPQPLFSKAKVSTPIKSPPVYTIAKPEPLANVSLVRSKDILPSSPQQSRFATQDQGNETESSRAISQSTPAKPKPLAPTKSPLLSERPVLEANKFENYARGDTESRGLTSTRPLLSDGTSGVATPPSSAPKDSPALETPTPNVSVKSATALWAQQGGAAPSSPGRPKSPVKLPTRHDEEKAMQEAGLMPPPQAPEQTRKPAGLGISTPTSGQTPIQSKTSDRSPRKLPLSPPLSPSSSAKPSKPASRTLIMPGKPNEPSFQVPKLEGARTRPTSASMKAPPESPIPHTSEANRLFTDFFDDRPVVAPVADDLDTVAILESYPFSNEKVSTLSKQLQLISGDGKLLPVPPHQEHILFNDSMYVCTHVFTSSKGSKSTEVYLWAGDEVPQATVEDAQLFGRRVAKDNGGRLIVLTQGKETPNFFQALGGILITFRGSGSRSASGMPSTFMLCGRRHMGHIAFDEVDLSLNSLCSGFPYLISSNSRLYLWKGKGCGAEELGCARLIATDIGTAPDFAEIPEGSESNSFLDLFPPLEGLPDKTIPRSADHWRLKASNDKYRCRLFCVEQTHRRNSTLQVSSFFTNLTRRSSWSSLTSPRLSPTHIEQPKTPTTPKPLGSSLSHPTETHVVEIAPFTQRDVEAEKIYVFDCFWEILVLIGPLAQSQSHAFATALLFAQDYGILSASLEDRPFVPVSTVVLEGVPRDMKPCFRQWSDDAFGFRHTEALMAGKPKRGGSLRCVGLAAALAATRG